MLCNGFAYPKLIHFFEEISRIPRGSYHEEKITAYLVEFAKERGLEYYSDEVGNVLINYTPEEEGKDALLLQGHTDMVCEKNAGVEHDFLRDPLKLFVKDGWLRAEGTTLGADNGVAVAAMLTLLDEPTLVKRPIQCLFTVSEEVGLDGAKAFDYSRIYARKMINMDSADEKMIIAGCAGGLRSSLCIPVSRDERGGEFARITVKGLFGGHSGEDIHRGRANANKVMGRILLTLSMLDSDLCLVSVNGGTKENAIPRECVAVIACKDSALVSRCCETISEEIRKELCKADSNFEIRVEGCEPDMLPMTKESSDTLIYILSTVANGVFEMNDNLEDVVEYSRNLGITLTREGEAELVFNSRSSMESRIDLSARELDAYARTFSGVTNHFNRYPGWTYAESSEIREEYSDAFYQLFGSKPQVEVIHAGLECGIIKKALPHMDMLSCGPVVVNLHSPDEALDIASFERFFSVILNIVG